MTNPWSIGDRVLDPPDWPSFTECECGSKLEADTCWMCKGTMCNKCKSTLPEYTDPVCEECAEYEMRLEREEDETA